MTDLIKFWTPIFIVILFFLYTVFVAINIIKKREYRGSKGREAVLFGILFIVIAFSLGFLTIKIYTEEGVSGIISLGTHILNHR